MLDLLWSTIFRWRLRPRQVTGDAKYGTRENVAALEKVGIRAYVAIPNFDFRNTGLFAPEPSATIPKTITSPGQPGQTFASPTRTPTTRARGTGRSPRSATPASSKRGAP